MKLRDFPLLTDENLDPNVVAHLRQVGFDVLDVIEAGLQGSKDVDLLHWRRRKDVSLSATILISGSWRFFKMSR